MVFDGVLSLQGRRLGTQKSCHRSLQQLHPHLQAWSSLEQTPVGSSRDLDRWQVAASAAGEVLRLSRRSSATGGRPTDARTRPDSRFRETASATRGHSRSAPRQHDAAASWRLGGVVSSSAEGPGATGSRRGWCPGLAPPMWKRQRPASFVEVRRREERCRKSEASRADVEYVDYDRHALDETRADQLPYFDCMPINQ